MEQQEQPKKRNRIWNSFTKPERSWITYDWANSVYATNIMAAIFPIYFAMHATDAGNKWYGIGVSIASFLVAILAPILGAVGDIKGYKKKLLTAFMLIGVIFTALMAAVGTWQLMLIGYIISRIGFSGSCVFYDAFLTDVTTDERMDRVSAWGYAMGYIGGSTIPFIISIAVLILGKYSDAAFKFSILIVSVWWFLFSIPMLKNVQQKHYIEAKASGIGKTAWSNFLSTLKGLVTNKGLLIFVLAYFCYIDGVDTIISMATNYGTTLGLGSIGMILALLVTQIVAVPCSILFSKLAAKFRALRMITIAIGVYFLITLVGFCMGRMAEPAQLAYASMAKEAAVSYEPAGLGEEDQQIWDESVEQLVEDGRELVAKPLTLTENGLSERENAYFGLYEYDETDGYYKPVGVFAELLIRMEDPNGAYYNDTQYTQYVFSSEEARSKVYAALDGLRCDASLKASVLDEDFTESAVSAVHTASILFWVLAALVGTVQGGIQALSRSYYAKLVPPERSNEYFGFFDIFAKFAAVIGPMLYALCYMWTGRASYGILSLLILFLAGGLLLILGRKTLYQAEETVRLEKQQAQRLEE